MRLRTLGGVQLDGSAGPLTGAATQRRRLALLCLLASSRNGQSRDRLVGLLWPESDEAHGKHALAQLLYAIRRELGGDVIIGAATGLRLNRDRLTSDIQDFAEALARGDREAAADLYAGPFMDGFYLAGCADFERWVEEERSRLAHRARDAIERLANDCGKRGDAAAALLWFRRLAALDPLDGRGALSLLRALADAGDRAAALVFARAHAAVVRQELGTEPDPAFLAFAASLSVPAPPAGDETPGENGARPVTPDHARERHAPPLAAAETPPPGQRPHARIPRRMLAAGGAFAATFATMLVATQLGSSTRLPAAPGELPDWVVVADVENGARDPVFERTIPLALAAGLRQSRRMHVLPPDRIRQTLERMRQPNADSVLDQALAREIARREGARLVLIPAIESAGAGFEISGRFVDPLTGELLSLSVVRAATRADVIGALDRLVRALRRDAGESMLSVARHSVRLPRVTTPSLDALERYAAGNHAFTRGRLEEAAQRWGEAVAIDSAFVSAHASLGFLLYWLNQPTRAEPHFARAEPLLDQLPTRERALIRARIESARGNHEAASSVLAGHVAQQPEDVEAWSRLGYEYLRMGRREEGAEVLRRAAALDSMDHTAFANLAAIERGLTQYDSALVHYRRAFALLPGMETQNNNINLEFGSTFVLMGQPDSARAVFSLLLDGDDLKRARGLRSHAFLAMHRGRFTDASTFLAEAIDLSRATDQRLSEIRNRLMLAMVHEQLGLSARSAAQLDTAYALTAGFDVDPTMLFWLGKALARTGQVTRASLLLDTLEAKRHPDSRPAGSAADALRGEILVASGRAADALPLLERAVELGSTLHTLESLAHGLGGAGQLERALAAYDQLAQGREFGWEGQVYWRLAPFTVGLLAERAGDAARAAAAYAQFITQWPDAEPFPLLLDARARLARLESRRPG